MSTDVSIANAAMALLPCSYATRIGANRNLSARLPYVILSRCARDSSESRHPRPRSTIATTSSGRRFETRPRRFCTNGQKPQRQKQQVLLPAQTAIGSIKQNHGRAFTPPTRLRGSSRRSGISYWSSRSWQTTPSPRYFAPAALPCHSYPTPSGSNLLGSRWTPLLHQCSRQLNQLLLHPTHTQARSGDRMRLRLIHPADPEVQPSGDGNGLRRVSNCSPPPWGRRRVGRNRLGEDHRVCSRCLDARGGGGPRWLIRRLLPADLHALRSDAGRQHARCATRCLRRLEPRGRPVVPRLRPLRHAAAAVPGGAAPRGQAVQAPGRNPQVTYPALPLSETNYIQPQLPTLQGAPGTCIITHAGHNASPS